MSPERLWRLSTALRRRGYRRLALMVKKVNSAIYHNSLAPAVVFSPDIRFGHHGFGTVIHSNVDDRRAREDLAQRDDRGARAGWARRTGS